MMKFSNRMYDVLKYFCTIGLPALATLYNALAGIWGFLYQAEITGTITAIATCLGILLGISSSAYQKEQNRAEQSIDTNSNP